MARLGRRYLDAASAAVTAMGGHVAKKLGDGLLSLFGYPAIFMPDSESFLPPSCQPVMPSYGNAIY
jgi:class 3 adenylate cyclase